MKIQTTMRGRKAFTLVELLVVIAVLAVVIAILLPGLMPRSPALHRNPRINCVNNLKEDVLAFKIWANDNGEKYPTQILATNGGAMEFAEKGIVFPVFQVMSNEINAPKILHCPADANHVAATNFTTDLDDSKISYFVSLDASEQNPNSILMGDDNFIVNRKPISSDILNLTSSNVVEWTNERHHHAGNIALADGSVQQTTSPSLNNLISATGMTTNRLVIP